MELNLRAVLYIYVYKITTVRRDVTNENIFFFLNPPCLPQISSQIVPKLKQYGVRSP